MTPISAPSSSAIGSGTDSLVLNVSEDPYQGDAQFTVAIDGIQVGGTFTTTALRSQNQYQPFTFRGNWNSGVHSVSVTFLNDLYLGTPEKDRNLNIVSVYFNDTWVPDSSGSCIQSLQFAFGNSLLGSSAPTIPAPTNKASRYDMISSSSYVSLGSPVKITFYPNGAWKGEIITPFLSKGSGTFVPSPISTANGSRDPVFVTYTPSANGEHLIKSTNNGALANPYGAPVNVYSPAGGSAQPINAALSSGSEQTFQFDSLTGNSGFSFSGAKGWGEVWVDIHSLGGTSSGLFAKLYDADSSGASANAGTGTALNSQPVQVYGTINNTGSIRLLLPASTKVYYLDLATDAAFTQPFRVSQRFTVGLVIGVLGRSEESGFIQWWSDITVPNGETWSNTFVHYSNDYRYGGGGPWSRVNGDSHGADNATTSAGPMAAGRLIASQMGVALGIVGVAAGIGGGMDQYVGHDGSLSAAFTSTIDQLGINGKFRWLWAASLSGWDGVDSNFLTSTYVETQSRLFKVPGWLATHYPACAIIGFGLGTTGGAHYDGSSPNGAARELQIVLAMEASDPRVVAKDNHNWYGFKYGHANQCSKRLYTQSGIRELLAPELKVFNGMQTDDRGPVLANAGFIKRGSRVIRLLVKLRGGTKLQATTISQNNSYVVQTGVASPNQLANLVQVYGPNLYFGVGRPISIEGVAINNADVPEGYDATLDITLAGSDGVIYVDGKSGPFPSGFNVHYAADFGASGGSGWLANDTTGEPQPTSTLSFITDDQVGGAWEWGRHIKPKVDIVISVL